MFDLSEALYPFGLRKSQISNQFSLHVIVINKYGYPNILQMTITSWQLLNIYLIPHVNEASKTTRLPIEEGSVSPLLTTSCNPFKISYRISF